MGKTTQPRSRWYWAELIVARNRAGTRVTSKSISTVHFDLIIMRARSPKEAVEKAVRAGESRSGIPLNLGRRDYCTEFLGVKGIGLLHEGLVDGAEISYSESRMSRSRARRYAMSEDRHVALLKQELEPIEFVERMTKAERRDLSRRLREIRAAIESKSRRRRKTGGAKTSGR